MIERNQVWRPNGRIVLGGLGLGQLPHVADDELQRVVETCVTRSGDKIVILTNGLSHKNEWMREREFLSAYVLHQNADGSPVNQDGV